MRPDPGCDLGPCRTGSTVQLSEEHLPNASLVVDHFHAIKLAENTAIDDVRRRVQQDTLGHRGRKGYPLYRARRALLSASERLSEERFEWMQIPRHRW
ncbi:MAG: transposase [Microthrixaceae bacterium]